jgi:uncharacterized damage-inducible protein DinB
MQYTDTLTTFFKHHLWANMVLLERCAQLTDEQLDTTVVGTYGTIRDTLQHITRAEQGYFNRVSTGQPLIRPDNEPQMTLAEITESLQKTGTGFIELAAKIPADDTVQMKWQDGKMYDVPKSIIINQALYHGIEHRAQIMVIMTQVGVEPPDLQSWVYFDEHKE